MKYISIIRDVYAHVINKSLGSIVSPFGGKAEVVLEISIIHSVAYTTLSDINKLYAIISKSYIKLTKQRAIGDKNGKSFYISQ
jgi:hypothetical protein